ncbi:hypothetical protein JKP88DRAFT_149760, partial [Tribonema minus]
SDTAPAWRGVARGINVECLCGNAQCAAYGEVVIHSVGMGAFALGDACACPLCHVPSAPVACAVYNCVWMFEGVKAGGGAVLSGAWRETGDAYERFNTRAEGESGGGGMADWERLVL